jgi:6-phosphogluconolactonase
MMLVSETTASFAAHAVDILVREIWATVGTKALDMNAETRKVQSGSIASRHRVSIAISGGRTPLPVLALLGAKKIPWGSLAFFWVDERFVPHNDPKSNYGAAKAALFDHVPATLFPFPDPRTCTLEAGADAYERTLRHELGHEPVLDIAVLGVGDDGHTASLFPGEPEVHEQERDVIAVPARKGRDARLTLTAPMIARAQTLIVLAEGETKQAPIARARTMPPGDFSAIPAHLVEHAEGRALWVLDPKAAGKT